MGLNDQDSAHKMIGEILVKIMKNNVAINQHTYHIKKDTWKKFLKISDAKISENRQWWEESMGREPSLP